MYAKARQTNNRICSATLILLLLSSTFSFMPLRVQAQSPPMVIGARANADHIEGWGWTIGQTLSIEIEDETTEESPDYSTSFVVEGAEWDPNYSFDIFTEGYDLKVGDIITATDGLVTKQLIVDNLTIIDVDLEADIVYGIAQPEQFVSVWTCDDWGCDPHRNLIADLDGYWEADFGNPGPNEGEEFTADLQPGSWIDSGVWDEDGDSTFYGITVPNPVIFTRAYDDQIEGWDWPIGDIVTIEVDDPATEDCPDYTKTLVVEIVEGDPHSFLFYTEGYDLKPGDQITASGEFTTKELVVSSLSITEVDLALDIVYGIAEAGASFDVWTCDEWGCDPYRHVIADEFGDWSADFGVPGSNEGEEFIADLQPGSWIDSGIWDDEGDATLYGITVPNPVIFTRAYDDQIEGWDWPIGDIVTIEVDDPATEDCPDYSKTLVVEIVEEDPHSFLFYTEGYDLKPGDQITASGEFTTKELVVSSLAITEVDLELNIVYGIAEPDRFVEVWTCDAFGCDPHRYIFADAEGKWSADFGVPGEQEGEELTSDLRHGKWIDSAVWDDDSDQTMYGWYVDTSNEFLPWLQMNEDGFGNPENQQIPSLTTFKGYLYAGVWQWHEDGPFAEVWRTDGSEWEMVDHRDTNGCAAIISYRGFLYCGSWDMNGEGGTIWRSSNGMHWKEDVNYDSDGIARFAVFRTKLYASTWDHLGVGSEIWETTNGVDWVLSNTPGFGDVNNIGAIASEDFGGDLYWGTLNFETGAQIWRTNGASYEKVMGDGFGLVENAGITALSTFDGYLYAVTANSTTIEVWRTEDGLNWENALVFPMYQYPLEEYLISGLEAFDGYLYLVARNDMTGLEVWRTDNGLDWTQVSHGGFEDGNNRFSFWDNAITKFDDQLYIGTINFESGGEIWTFHPSE